MILYDGVMVACVLVLIVLLWRLRQQIDSIETTIAKHIIRQREQLDTTLKESYDLGARMDNEMESIDRLESLVRTISDAIQCPLVQESAKRTHGDHP